MQSANLQNQFFQPAAYLQPLCKKQNYYEDQLQKQKLEIDFLALEKALTSVQQIQQKTCEQIVEFVDQHREKFIQINLKLRHIQSKVNRSEIILKLLGSRIDQYKSGYYVTESKIQRFINDYELRLIQQQVIGMAKVQAAFLLKFNSQFERITNKQIAQLNLSQRYLISRFTFKLKFFKQLFSHQIIQQFVPQLLQIGEIVCNLGDEFQFYLSEQLAKYQLLRGRAAGQVELKKLVDILDQVKGWYMNLDKKLEYYSVLEKNTIQKQMLNAQKLLIANKTILMSGKESQIMQNVFSSIFGCLNQFPQNYPKERLRYLILNFFRKQQIKFIYTYAMPIFPLAYKSYLNAIETSRMEEWLSCELKEYNGWNLKMWVMVREKNILDRSSGDSDMLKWVDIIFKSACMLSGTVAQFTKLAFKLVNRYLNTIVNSDFAAPSFNRLVEQHQRVGELVGHKIVQNMPNATEMALKIQNNLKKEYERVIKQLLNKTLGNVTSSCINSLQPVKTFVSKIIKKDKQFIQTNTINKPQNLFRPLNAFLKNNAELSLQALNHINACVEAQLVKHYDAHYAIQIYSYSKDHLVSEQLAEKEPQSLLKQKIEE